MIGDAERRFPVRIRIAVPPDGLGTRLDRIKAWLDENCGADAWVITPSGLRGIVNLIAPPRRGRWRMRSCSLASDEASYIIGVELYVDGRFRAV